LTNKWRLISHPNIPIYTALVQKNNDTNSMEKAVLDCVDSPPGAGVYTHINRTTNGNN